jgi:hypothetical protein
VLLDKIGEIMKHTNILIVLVTMIFISAAANAATKTPAEPALAVKDFSHQVRVRWVPQVDSGGRQVVQLTIEYTRSADTPAADALSVAVMPSNRVLMRVIDPESQMALKAKKIESAGRTSSYVTAYAKLDHFTETVILPYAPGADDHIFIAEKGENGLRILARTKADLANPVTFTATTGGARISSPAFRRGVIHAEATTYCYESDWCQPVCIACDSLPIWNSGECDAYCSGDGGGDHVCFFEDDPCPPFNLF